MQAAIIAALADYGMTDVAIFPVLETPLFSVRITDQPYDIDLMTMIAKDIVEPLGVEIYSYGCNARYDTDDKVGGVIIYREAA